MDANLTKQDVKVLFDLCDKIAVSGVKDSMQDKFKVVIIDNHKLIFRKHFYTFDDEQCPEVGYNFFSLSGELKFFWNIDSTREWNELDQAYVNTHYVVCYAIGKAGETYQSTYPPSKDKIYTM